MSGIVFYKTTNLKMINQFYVNKIGMEIWLKQLDCLILKHGNMLLGFCDRNEIDRGGMITFFYPNRDDVKNMHDHMNDYNPTDLIENKKYSIYQFFANDPEGRTLEFQSFLHSLPPHLGGTDVLQQRRSIRRFTNDPVPENVLWDIFETCRYAPTSKNSQSYYFVVIKNSEKKKALASIRDGASRPIDQASIAVAICSDPGKTLRPEQDGCIAAYHFILTAWSHGLGTCWIAAMNRTEVKEILNIPQDHYVATVTPLGFPVHIPPVPERRDASEMVTVL